MEHLSNDSSGFNIEHILTNWPFDPHSINVRLLKNAAREVLQMRVDMGILQLETDGRPDGKRPNGESTYYDFLKAAAIENKEFVLQEQDCVEIDREFVQYYHRRICWLQLKEFDRAVSDADHTLGLMDFCKQFSQDEEWTISHEQYRPFVLYHRTQAAALAALNAEVADSAQSAIDEVDLGLEEIRSLFEQYNAGDQFEGDELVQRLVEFRDGLRDKFELGESMDVLESKLKEAIDSEDYEAAAELRDKIAEIKNQTDLVLDEMDELGLDIDEF
ncbi:MAG: UvrB/UvrC motif-containing protein [Planctomycetota bacterium]